MRIGPLGLPELIVLFVYLTPVLLLLWFLVDTVRHRRRVERRLKEIGEALAALRASEGRSTPAERER